MKEVLVRLLTSMPLWHGQYVWIAKNNSAIDLYCFSIVSRFVDSGIQQFRINHYLWLFGTAPLACLRVDFHTAEVLHQRRFIMGEFIGCKQRF